jgi:hypothetical protein
MVHCIILQQRKRIASSFFRKLERGKQMDAKHERPPKILPWLARQAGIPIELAEAFWIEAVTEAGRRRVRGSSDYWKVATDRLLEKIAAEALLRHRATFGMGLWLRLPLRLCLHAIDFAEAVTLDGSRRWRGAA